MAIILPLDAEKKIQNIQSMWSIIWSKIDRAEKYSASSIWQHAVVILQHAKNTAHGKRICDHMKDKHFIVCR